jgi:hypothetical protein
MVLPVDSAVVDSAVGLDLVAAALAVVLAAALVVVLAAALVVALAADSAAVLADSVVADLAVSGEGLVLRSALALRSTLVAASADQVDSAHPAHLGHPAHPVSQSSSVNLHLLHPVVGSSVGSVAQVSRPAIRTLVKACAILLRMPSLGCGRMARVAGVNAFHR